MGDADYILAFQKIIMPIALEFSPELVMSKPCLSEDEHKGMLIRSLCYSFRRIRCGGWR